MTVSAVICFESGIPDAVVVLVRAWLELLAVPALLQQPHCTVHMVTVNLFLEFGAAAA